MDKDLISALRRAGIELTDQNAPSFSAAPGAGQESLREQGFATVSGLLGARQLDSLRDYLRGIVRRQASIGDAQCERRYGVHNEPLLRFFHHQLANVVTRLAGERVIPSYCYFAGYRDGAALACHTDREQCEFTISFLVEHGPESSPSWPIWLKLPAETVAVHQAPGDALIFRGRELPHWRMPLGPGQWSYSLLLHYVPAAFSGRLH
ncbi:hypothetical protein [Pseudoduganella sp. HUAS MS19]